MKRCNHKWPSGRSAWQSFTEVAWCPLCGASYRFRTDRVQSPRREIERVRRERVMDKISEWPISSG